MRKLFVAIRKGELDTVKALLEKDPSLVSSIATSPKKDVGQSTLQVAIKSGNLEIAEYLLDAGADVNFMEAEDCGSDWRMPVVQDAIMAAVMSSRWNTVHPIMGMQIYGSSSRADQTFHLLKRMIEMGADIHKLDSNGNNGLFRAVIDAENILPQYNHNTGEVYGDRIVTDQLRADLGRIFDLLFAHGADENWVKPELGMSVEMLYGKGPVSEFWKK
jgi:hypothetical protein